MMSGILNRRGFSGEAGHQAGERLSPPGDLHRFAFPDPGRDARESITQVSDGCRFHCDTIMSHAADAVKALTINFANEPISTIRLPAKIC